MVILIRVKVAHSNIRRKRATEIREEIRVVNNFISIRVILLPVRKGIIVKRKRVYREIN